MRVIIIFWAIVFMNVLGTAQTDIPKEPNIEESGYTYECNWPVDSAKKLDYSKHQFGVYSVVDNSSLGNGYSQGYDNIEELTKEDEPKKTQKNEYEKVANYTAPIYWDNKVFNEKAEFVKVFKFKPKNIDWKSQKILVIAEDFDLQTHSSSSESLLGVAIKGNKLLIGMQRNSRYPEGPSIDLPISHTTNYYYLVIAKDAPNEIEFVSCIEIDTY
ncbi:MAG: hypothetical protein GY810_13800 [Aureispira sp.]|nr:hypothetical protein [Aureispira sp.]